MELPMIDSIPKLEGLPEKFSMLVFGPPKVGKTTFASEWPKAIILECEPGGADLVKCRKLDITCLPEFRAAYKLLVNDSTFETVVVDSLDRLGSWVEDEICAEMGLSNIMDSKKGERHGSQWGEYKARMLQAVSAMEKLNKKIIFLAHTKKNETDGNGLVINPKTINLYGATAIATMALIQNIGHMFAKEVEGGKTKRYLSFAPGMNVECGSRHPVLSDRILEIPKGKGYEVFSACFVPEKIEEKKKGGK